MHNVILEKTCNAFYPEAAGNLWGFGLGAMLGGAMIKGIQGGLWVGGNFRANLEWLYFEPGLFNSMVQSRVEPVRIHVSELRNIRRDSGWLTDIIIIDHARGEFKFRCYGAEEVCNTLRAYYFRSAY